MRIPNLPDTPGKNQISGFPILKTPSRLKVPLIKYLLSKYIQLKRPKVETITYSVFQN